ncbi:unnamed protein product [Ilex paraguariensis]|uniref:Uncharacterized protein n=1 Tax=Ilex paraguariensis TaxID=185542 RepID=A0ABC8SSI0_9AQUA
MIAAFNKIIWDKDLTLVVCSLYLVYIQAEEIGVGRDDGRPDLGVGRPRGGGLIGNGQGKPKKGRAGQREGKKIRLSSDLDLDDEDDPV